MVPLLLKMMVANSFDLWQKDAFFSAAEEVQGSADVYVSPFIESRLPEFKEFYVKFFALWVLVM